MLAAGANAFLSVRCTGLRGIPFAQEVGHKGVHACIGKLQIGGGRHQGGRGKNAVLLGGKEIQKTLADGGSGRQLRIHGDRPLPSG